MSQSEVKRAKQLLADSLLLGQDTYAPESAMYRKAHKALCRLPFDVVWLCEYAARYRVKRDRAMDGRDKPAPAKTRRGK